MVKIKILITPSMNQSFYVVVFMTVLTENECQQADYLTQYGWTPKTIIEIIHSGCKRSTNNQVTTRFNPEIAHDGGQLGTPYAPQGQGGVLPLSPLDPYPTN